MERPDRGRRLIVNADDFGRSPAVNAAVLQAHREGILTTASLMVNEPACAEAVALAKANPRLGVGLHLALLCGRAGLSPTEVPGLVNDAGEFSANPVEVGWRYFFQRSLRPQLEAEIAEQFRRFHATGLPLDHVNGHLHLHLHPVVFSLLVQNARRWGLTQVRLTRDPFWLNTRLARGRKLYRISHALIFGWLSRRARPDLARLGLRHTHRVFGLLQNARVDEAYIRALLPRLPPGDSELYSHPSTEAGNVEVAALSNPTIKTLVEDLAIRLIRYQDL